PPVQLMVLCTARPELLDRRPGWGGGRRNAASRSLAPLEAGDVAALLDALVSGVAGDPILLSDRDREGIVERAGGNPLYAGEFVRMRRDVSAEDVSGAAAGRASFPDTVYAVISARLDILALPHRLLLQDAAVVGQSFWPGALAAMSGRPSDEVAT